MIHLCFYYSITADAVADTVAGAAVSAAIDCECCFEIIFVPQNMSCGYPMTIRFCKRLQNAKWKKKIN